MTSAFNSTLSWLDSSERERRAVMELVSALSEPGTLDELGIGSIRDTIADALFPGTSTIQTRARYFLFIPWILRMVEGRPGAQPEQRAIQLQRQLCDALDVAHGSATGVIGREAKGNLKRWPMSIYWSGLERWGIRRYGGSTPAYFASLRRPSSLVTVAHAVEEPVEERRYEASDPTPRNWSPLPEPPDGFPETASFLLTDVEGIFLLERVGQRHPNTYLAYLLNNGDAVGMLEPEFPWEHPAAGAAPAAIQAWLHDARLFSLVHRGAALLYNFMLAQELGNDEREADFSRSLKEWSDDMEACESDLASWDRIGMWEGLWAANPKLRTRTREFVDSWHRLATTRPVSILMGDTEARRLIQDRERSLKGMRAKLSHPEALDNHSGYPSAAQMQFRWPQARRIAADILEPLRDA